MDITQAITPQHPGTGIGSLVPKDDARDFKQEKSRQQEKFSVDETATKFFIGLREKCEKRQDHQWRMVKKQMIRCRQYNDGEQYGDVNNRFEWVDVQTSKNEVIFFENMFHKHVKSAMTELTKAEPELHFDHKAGESRRGTLLTKFCQQRWETYRKYLFTPVQRHNEKLSGVLNGITARYTFFEQDESEAKESKIPAYSAKPQQIEESPEVCSMCYAPKQGETCSHCGNDEFSTMDHEDSEPQAIEMREEQARGENDFCNVDPIGLTFDLLASTINESPYMGWDQIVMDEILQEKYPDVELEEGVKPELIAATGSNTPGGSYLNNKHRQGKQISQWWFDYPLYCKTRLKSDVQLRNGKVIKADTELGKAFPKGCYVAFSGDKILDMAGEDKNRKWAIAPYGLRLGTLIGMGSTSMLSQQDRKNDIVNLTMTVLNRDAYRQEFLNSKYLTNDDMPDDPRMRAEIEGLPDTVRIVGGVVDALPPSGLSAIVGETEDKIEAATQSLMGTFAPSSGPGMSDMKGLKDTLGGVQMLRESTVSGFGPALEIQAFLLDAQQCYQLLENDQEYLTSDQWEEIAGDYGMEMVKEFLECDIRKEILITVVKESYMPQTKSQQQANLQGFVGISGAMMEIGQNKPEQMARVAEMFNQPQALEEFDQNYASAYEVIDTMVEIAETILQMTSEDELTVLAQTNPEAYEQLVMASLGEAQAPVNIEMQDHAAMISAYRDFWHTDKGRQSSQLLKDMIDMRVQEHLQAEVAKSQSDLMRQMEAEAPAMQQQQAQAEAEAAQNDEAMQAEQEGAMMEGLAEISENDAQREHEQVLKDADIEESAKERAHDADQKDLDRRHQKELAEHQAKQQAKAQKTVKK